MHRAGMPLPCKRQPLSLQRHPLVLVGRVALLLEVSVQWRAYPTRDTRLESSLGVWRSHPNIPGRPESSLGMWRSHPNTAGRPESSLGVWRSHPNIAGRPESSLGVWSSHPNTAGRPESSLGRPESSLGVWSSHPNTAGRPESGPRLTLNRCWNAVGCSEAATPAAERSYSGLRARKMRYDRCQTVLRTRKSRKDTSVSHTCGESAPVVSSITSILCLSLFPFQPICFTVPDPPISTSPLSYAPLSCASTSHPSALCLN
eukprot:365277-Chlamydomonas_euryale.AAC.9